MNESIQHSSGQTSNSLHQSGIRLLNIRKCPVQNNSHQRITSPALRKKTQNGILVLKNVKPRCEKGDFIPIYMVLTMYKIVHGLEKVNCCYENKILKPEIN